jgi:hypothetical protein
MCCRRKTFKRIRSEPVWTYIPAQKTEFDKKPDLNPEREGLSQEAEEFVLQKLGRNQDRHRSKQE